MSKYPSDPTEHGLQESAKLYQQASRNAYYDANYYRSGEGLGVAFAVHCQILADRHATKARAFLFKLIDYKAALARVDAMASVIEIMPGMYAVSLDSPEQLFRLLDDIERYLATGELPFNDNANIIAALQGKPPYFI